MAVKFFPPAEARLGQIWDYTFDTWGESQADAYIHELMAFIEKLPRQRAQWRPLKDPELPVAHGVDA
jgi:plasmid stabilization system protein ParE